MPIPADTLEQLQVADNLPSSEALLRLVLEASGTGWWSLDLRSEQMLADDRCKALFGLAPEIEPSFALFLEHLSSSDRAIAQQHLAEAHVHPGDYHTEYHVTWFDGTSHWILIKGESLPDAAGKPMLLMGVAMDVTDRKQAEEAWRESDVRARAMLEALEGLIYVCAEDCRIEFINDRFVQRLGRNPVGEFCYRALHDLNSPCPWCPWEKIRQGETVRWDVQSPHDGHWYHVVDTLIRHADGALSKQSMITDVTEQKRVQEALRKAHDDLEQKVAERTIILNEMIKALQQEVLDRRWAEQSLHENHVLLQQRMEQLRNMASELTQAEQRERRRLAQVLHDNLQQLLVAARLKVGGLRRRVETDDLRRVIAEVDELLAQCLDESRSLTVELSPPVLQKEGLAAGLEWLGRWMQEKHSLSVSVEHCHIPEPGDEETRVLLYQAVRELLFNCVKHAHVEQARVVMSVNNGELHILVSDEGSGFSVVSHHAANDSGFGLFSVSQRLESLGGRLELDSAPGQGTRITLRVPLPR